MCSILEEERRQGIAEGLKEGLKEGRLEAQIAIIRKKVEKQIDTETIAELLELNREEVQHIVGLLQRNENLSDLEIARKYEKE